MGTARRMLLATAVVCVAAAPAVALLIRDGASNQPLVSSSQELPFSLNGLIPTPDSFPGRLYPATAWNGERLFVGGGERYRDDGSIELVGDAALIQSDGTTDRLPDLPVGPLFEPAAAAVGDKVVVLGPVCDGLMQPSGGETPGCKSASYGGALLNVPSGEWQVLELPTALVGTGGFEPGGYRVTRSLGVTGDGRAVFAVGEKFNERFWTYDANSGEWESISQTGDRPDQYCLAGDILTVVTMRYDNAGNVLEDNPFRDGPQRRTDLTPTSADGYVQPRVLTLDLSDRSAAWSVPSQGDPDVKFPGISPPTVLCTSSTVVAYSGLDQTKIYHANVIGVPTWKVASAPPQALPAGRPFATADSVVFPPSGSEIGREGIAYQVASDAWVRVEGFPPITSEPTALPDGRTVVGYGEPGTVSFPVEAPSRLGPSSTAARGELPASSFQTFEIPAGIYTIKLP